MKIFIIFFLLCLSININGQVASISLGLDFGMLQLNKSVTTDQSYQTIYVPRIAPNIFISKKIGKTAFSIETGLRYSYSNLIIKEKVEPLFSNGEGFPAIRIKNEFYEIPLSTTLVLYQKENRFKVYSSLGFSVGIPLAYRKNAAFVEDSLFANNYGSVWKLNYYVLRTTSRAVFSIESGLGVDIKLINNLYISGIIYFRLGFYQSVTLNYRGEIYNNQNSDPLISSSFTSFSNNGAFLSIAVKRYF